MALPFLAALSAAHITAAAAAHATQLASAALRPAGFAHCTAHAQRRRGGILPWPISVADAYSGMLWRCAANGATITASIDDRARHRSVHASRGAAGDSAASHFEPSHGRTLTSPSILRGSSLHHSRRCASTSGVRLQAAVQRSAFRQGCRRCTSRGIGTRINWHYRSPSQR